MAMTTTLLDLINANLLQPGNKVMVRDIEGELTSQGTIISTTERGTIEYKTPTAFSKAVTNSTSGGWQQVKLKSSGGTTSLFDVKRKFAGYSSRRRREKMQKRDHHPVHHTPSVQINDSDEIKVGLNNVSLPIHIRFRDDDTKRGWSTKESHIRACHPLLERCTENMRKKQTSYGDWAKLRELFPVEIRKRATTPRSYHHHHDEDDEEEDDVMSNASEPDTPPTPPSPPSPSSTPPRSTIITKHVKHAILPPPSDSSSVPKIHPQSKASGSIILSLKSSPSTPPSHAHAHGAHTTHTKRQTKDIELLVHIESPDSIPYEVTGVADGYESLKAHIAETIPEFPFHQAHEMGIYSEYWEKHAGVAYVKPPRNWLDFPSCTTVLLKKIPEQIMISQFDI